MRVYCTRNTAQLGSTFAIYGVTIWHDLSKMQSLNHTFKTHPIYCTYYAVVRFVIIYYLWMQFNYMYIV